MQKLRKVQTCAKRLAGELPQGFSPQVGIVLGTGLGPLADSVENAVSIRAPGLDDFPPSSAPSHEGRFVAGILAGVPVILQQGRCHLYEGRRPDDICLGVRVMAVLGARGLIITNAAGAVNPLFDAGSLMCLDDHLNMTGRSPLTGPNQESWGPRFPDMSAPYDRTLIAVAERKALELGIKMEKGVYACVPGPQLETRAETRALRALGADAVGMSTVLEVIAARHMGLKVLGISCLTNKNLPDCMAETTIEEIIDSAKGCGDALKRLITASLPEMARFCSK